MSAVYLLGGDGSSTLIEFGEHIADVEKHIREKNYLLLLADVQILTKDLHALWTGFQNRRGVIGALGVGDQAAIAKCETACDRAETAVAQLQAEPGALAGGRIGLIIQIITVLLPLIREGLKDLKDGRPAPELAG